MSWTIATYELLAQERIGRYLREASDDRRAMNAAAPQDGRGFAAARAIPGHLLRIVASGLSFKIGGRRNRREDRGGAARRLDEPCLRT